MRLLIRSLLAFLIAAVLTSTAFAQTSGSIAGVVTSTDDKPLAGARVVLDGPRRASTVSDAQGRFSFEALPRGTYAVSANAGGYRSTTLAALAVDDVRVDANVTLSPATLSTIREIARVEVPANGTFNTSAAAASYLGEQTFRDRSAVQIGSTLDQVPGLASGRAATFNAAVPGSLVSPNIRGALDYEKQTLIDGHSIINGRFGDYPLTPLNTFLLDGVEVTKGPGAAATEIDYAINGTVNFRTAEPTRTPYGSLVLGVDDYGGAFSNVRFSGTTTDGRLGYVADYATYGTPGPLERYPAYVTLSPGTTIAGYGTITKAPYAPAPAPPSVVGTAPNGTTSLLACCQQVNSNYASHAQLAKLRYRFSNATSATLTYLGINAQYDGIASSFAQLESQFEPGAGYAGGLGAGPYTIAAHAQPLGTLTSENQPILEAELRTTLGSDSLVARYYGAALDQFSGDPLGNPAANYTTVPYSLYGTATVGGAPATFDGAAARLVIPTPYDHQVEEDQLRGQTFEYDHPLGANLLSFSVDHTSYLTDAYGVVGSPSGGHRLDYIPAGSRQDFTAYLLRATFNPTPQTTLVLANYYNVYKSRYTPAQNADGSFVYDGATHTHDDPRLGLTYRPNSDVSLRFAAGSSIAPPYIGLLDTLNQTPAQVYTPGATAVTIAQNSGALLPETAFGYDVGADARRGGNVLSFDAYLTNLRNQFVSTFAPSRATFTVPGTATQIPVYINRNANVADARFAGLELTLSRDPAKGVGYKVDGTLQRAYAYDLSPGFYATANGPQATNLGVVPGLNYVADNRPFSFAFNGISNKSEAYALGYAEVHWRSAAGRYAQLEATYYGANNTYNVPAFAVLGATYRMPLGDAHTLLQFGVDNVTSAYSVPWITAYGGLGTPLVDGKTGRNNAIPIGPAGFHITFARDFGT